MITKEEIFDTSHLDASSDLARAYFKECGLKIEEVTLIQCAELIEFITDEIKPLLADKSYQMVKDLRMNKRIKKDKYGIYLLTDGSYFKERQAVSFLLGNRRIIFCNWASGCNRIPYIKGFVKWCDYLKEQKENLN